MTIVRLGSSHEMRLIHEGRMLNRRLKRMVRANGAEPSYRDALVEKFNHDLGCDIVGLVTLKLRAGFVYATLISAPGQYFFDGKPERRRALDQLADARRAQGRKTLIVTKHQIPGRVPFDLLAALGGPAEQDRRRERLLLGATGRRTFGADRPGLTAALRHLGIVDPLDIEHDDEVRTDSAA